MEKLRWQKDQAKSLKRILGAENWPSDLQRNFKRSID